MTSTRLSRWLAELIAPAPVRKRASVAPRYANPFKPDETWSGRGRKPRWFDEALAAGKTVDDLQI